MEEEVVSSAVPEEKKEEEKVSEKVAEICLMYVCTVPAILVKEIERCPHS